YAKRLALDVPPTGLFWFGGKSGKQMIDAGLFRKIPTKFGDLDFSKILLPEIYDVVRYKDGITILPVGNHIQNRIFYNKNILDEIHGKIPKTWTEFLTMAPKIKKAGYYPIIVTAQRWQNRYFFLAILAEKLNIEQMRHLFAGDIPIENYRSALLSSMQIMTQLRQYINPDIGDLSWEAGIGKIYHNTGFAFILGDFTGALIPKDNKTVICTSPPGNKYLMWAVDGIALQQTDNIDEIAGQNILIEEVGKKENHQKYISVKGGVSSYIDSNNDNLDNCAKASKKDWEETEDKIFVTSEEFTQTLDTFAIITTAFWLNQDMTPQQAVSQMIEAIQEFRQSQMHQSKNMPEN
ncbi:MAG TPA: extracellular solute-binding protein, partial [Oceanospirillales bacterium]|nr:extracellular solute-binding protein [Oceanospirillales bacterium]